MSEKELDIGTEQAGTTPPAKERKKPGRPKLVEKSPKEPKIASQEKEPDGFVEVAGEQTDAPDDSAIFDVFYDHRRDMITDEWDKKEPDFVHIWQSEESQERVSNKHMEVVRDEGGRVVKFGTDILCKQPARIFRGLRKMEQEASLRNVRKLVGGNLRRVMLERRPVNPRQNDDADLGEF